MLTSVYKCMYDKQFLASKSIQFNNSFLLMFLLVVQNSHRNNLTNFVKKKNHTEIFLFILFLAPSPL